MDGDTALGTGVGPRRRVSRWEEEHPAESTGAQSVEMGRKVPGEPVPLGRVLGVAAQKGQRVMSCLSRQARSGLLQLMRCHAGGAIGSGFLEKESGHSSLRGGDVGAVAECTARPEARTRGLLPAQ